MPLRSISGSSARKVCARWLTKIYRKRNSPSLNWKKFPEFAARSTAPIFNEFTVEFPRSVKLVNAHLLREKIIGPFVLGTAYPELTKHALVCVTETTTRGEIERFAAALRRTLEKPLTR